MKRSILNLALMAVFLAGCTDATNQRLDAMNKQIELLNKQIEADQTHIKTLDENSSRIAKETEAYEEVLRDLARQAGRVAQTLEQFQKIGESLSSQMQPPPPGGSPASPAWPGNSARNEVTPSAPVRAEPQGPQIRLDEAFCVKKDVRHLYEQITDYDGYAKMPGAKYNVPGVGILIQMISSQGRFSVHAQDYSTADVAIVLQPLTINEAGLYPKLVIHCDSKWVSDKIFEHQCFLDQSKPHFALTNLISHFRAEIGGCEKGLVRVTYQMSLQTNEREVLAIKDRVVANFKMLGPIVARLFNEELFFKAYFRNLYNSWIKTGAF